MHALSDWHLLSQPEPLTECFIGCINPPGAGHSWNQPFFCANATGTAPTGSSTARPARRLGTRANAGTGSPEQRQPVNIAMTTIRPLSIHVNTSAGYAWVDAPVITADLLQYLANYVTEDAPAGARDHYLCSACTLARMLDNRRPRGGDGTGMPGTRIQPYACSTPLRAQPHWASRVDAAGLPLGEWYCTICLGAAAAGEVVPTCAGCETQLCPEHAVRHTPIHTCSLSTRQSVAL